MVLLGQPRVVGIHTVHVACSHTLHEKAQISSVRTESLGTESLGDVLHTLSHQAGQFCSGGKQYNVAA